MASNLGNFGGEFHSDGDQYIGNNFNFYGVQSQTEDDRKCLQLLSSNYGEHKDRVPERVDGTCEWFLRHQMFLKWRDEDMERLLLVSALPGCGKSVLSKALVDEGLLNPQKLDRRRICYFFFKD